MPSFIYVARDRGGLIQSGQLEAAREDDVLAALQGRGLIVTSLARKELRELAPSKLRTVRSLHGRVTLDDLVHFCQQLATLIEAGVPLLRSLEVVSLQVESRALLAATEQIRRDIEAGSKFGQALAKHPAIFSSLWVSLVETGEASGTLALALSQIAKYLESVRNLRTKATTALVYPLVLVVAAICVLAFFMLKIIPIFSGIFKQMDVELPLLTRIILAISDAARHYTLLVLAGLLAAGWAARRFFRTERGRWLRDRAALRLPVFKSLFSQLQVAFFSQGISTLLSSGVPILTGLEIMEGSASNLVYGRAIGEIRVAVRQGKPMAEPMGRTGLFPPMMVQMVQVGEEIGELDKMLSRVAKYYEERVDTFIARLSVLFEPIAIVVMAVVIGLLVVSMFLPIFSLAGGTTAGGGH